MNFSILAYRGYLDEAQDTGDTGGGGGDTSTIDIDAVSDQLGADLGLTSDSDDKTKTADDAGSATPPVKKDSASAPPDQKKLAEERAGKIAAARAKLATEKVDFTGKTDDEILALANPKRGVPKSWKQEMHPFWDKVDPKVQEYWEQRETEYESGIKSHAQASEYGRGMAKVFADYQPMLDAQGIKDHASATRYLLNAHYMLSTANDDQRAQFFATLARSYKIDPQKLSASWQGQVNAPQETAAEKANRERIDRLENDRKAERDATYAAVKADVDKEIAAFEADPAHLYFKEVAREVALLMQDPNISLKAAYESAVWANPVTRAKEQARLQTEAEAKAKKEADEKAAAALKAKGTTVKGDERHRASPDLLGSMDDTLRSTFRNIQNRQE